MANLGEVPSPEFDTPMSLGEVEVFRDSVLFPSVNYLSHGTFDADAIGPQEDFTIEGTVLTPDGLVRNAIEAFGWMNRNADSDRLGEKTVTVKIIQDRQLVDQTTVLKQMAQDSMDPDGTVHIPFLHDEEEDISAWETTILTFDRDGDDTVRVEKHKVLEDEEGAYHWSDEELSPTEAGGELTADEKTALYDLRDRMETVLHRSECRIVVEVLLARGLPQEVLQEFTRAADLEGIITTE
jgi:hypothetical protein